MRPACLHDTMCVDELFNFSVQHSPKYCKERMRLYFELFLKRDKLVISEFQCVIICDMHTMSSFSRASQGPGILIKGCVRTPQVFSNLIRRVHCASPHWVSVHNVYVIGGAGNVRKFACRTRSHCGSNEYCEKAMNGAKKR